MIQAPTLRLILASASAARRAVLAAAGLRFESHAAAIDEAAVKAAARADGLSATNTALLLADLKAQRIAARDPDALVIGCDQLLVCGDAWFDKPADRAEARDHLIRLRGRPHTLITAVLCHRNGQRLWHHVAKPSLTMRPFTDTFLDAYLDAEADHLTSTVGAYRLEGPGVQFVAG